MPWWLRSLLMAMIIVVFSASFYLFFIRPYAFRWHLHGSRTPYYMDVPRGYNVNGLDISHHQGEINWEKIAKYRSADVPLQFVFIKATEGTDLVDESFHRNFSLAHKYGFIRGAYHYYNPQVDPIQ
jgi:lysozyme